MRIARGAVGAPAGGSLAGEVLVREAEEESEWLRPLLPRAPRTRREEDEVEGPPLVAGVGDAAEDEEGWGVPAAGERRERSEGGLETLGELMAEAAE